MNNEYKSVLENGQSRYEEKKSIFLGFTQPVSTEQEALSYLNTIKKKYPDAKHHVYAYIIKDTNTIRFSDDGEPQGTAGVPILDILKKQNLSNIVVVVVRYFGGTLLGTGGLVHAYSKACTDSISNASVVEYILKERIELTCSYSYYQKIQKVLLKVKVVESTFNDQVDLIIEIPKQIKQSFIQELNSIMNNNYTIVKSEDILGIK